MLGAWRASLAGALSLRVKVHLLMDREKCYGFSLFRQLQPDKA
jgi:hypothetical protein